MSDIIPLNTALELERKDIFELYKNHINPNFANMLSLLNFDKQYVKAEGTRVWDSDGNVYLDFLGGYGALNFGHNHPYIISAVEKVKEMPNILQASIGSLAAVLAANLVAITPKALNKVFFCNSGAEAVEGSLKLARIATGKTKFVSCDNSFHGKSFGALSVTGRDKYQKYFRPLLNSVQVPFGNLDALEQELRKKDVAAFIVEPIQGEGGINIPPTGYLKRAKEICKKYDTLLIVDEIQTGFGRTGYNFAVEYEEVEPDLLCLAKSLGGGIMPVGAYIATDEVWNKGYGTMDKALLHTSTFGGNTYAAAAGIAATEVLIKDNIAAHAKEKGQYLIDKLNTLKDKYDLVKDVRGRGLIVGIEFEQPTKGLTNKLTGGLLNKVSEEYLASLVAGELQNQYKIITAYTLNNPNVIRLEPPLTVTFEEIDYLIESLESVFEKYKSFLSLALSSGKKIVNTFFNKKI